MNKHTPGPWFYRVYPSTKDAVIYSKIRGPLGDSIDGTGIAFDVSPGDAPLISSAPELLECARLSHDMLVEIAPVLEKLDGRLKDNFETILGTMKMVIAKATGGKP